MKGYIIKTNYSFCDEEIFPCVFFKRERSEEKLKEIGVYSSGDRAHYGYRREIEEWEIIE